jgi:Acetyltransferase (GNAT) domain
VLKRVVAPLRLARRTPQWWAPLLAASCRQSIFLTPAWLDTWLEIYGDEFDGEWVCWERDGKAVGGCLVLSHTLRKGLIPLRRLYLNATGMPAERTPFAEFNDVLYLPSYCEEIARDFAAYLLARRWDQLFLSGYESLGVSCQVARMLPAAARTHAAEAAPFVPLVEPAGGRNDQTPPASVSANTRRKVRRSQRLFEEHGALSLVRAESVEEALAYLGALAVLHNERRKNKGEQGAFESAKVTAFHQKLVSRLWPSAQVDLVKMKAGDYIVGYLYNFVYAGKVYCFQSGFRYDGNGRSKPGLVMDSLLMEKYRTEGQLEYDFLAGDSEYKRSLAKHSRQLMWTVIHRDTWWMRLLLFAHALRK